MRIIEEFEPEIYESVSTLKKRHPEAATEVSSGK